MPENSYLEVMIFPCKPYKTVSIYENKFLWLDQLFVYSKAWTNLFSISKIKILTTQKINAASRNYA